MSSHSVKPNAAFIDFENADLTPVLEGIINNPFPSYPQIKRLEVLDGPALIVKVRDGTTMKGKALYKPGWGFEPTTSKSYHLRFWFDQPYTQVEFDYRHVDSPRILYQLFDDESDSAIHSGTFDNLTGKQDFPVTISFSSKPFAGLSLKVLKWRDEDIRMEFLIDNLLLK